MKRSILKKKRGKKTYMTKRGQRLLNVAMILISWLTVPFVGWRSLKTVFPASLIMFLLAATDAYFGKQRKWWEFYNKPQSFLRDELPFHFGPFFVTSIWVLKYNYGNFKKFLTINGIIHWFFAYPCTVLFDKLGIFKLVRLKRFQFFLYFFYKATLLYVIQYFMEKRKNRRTDIHLNKAAAAESSSQNSHH